MSYMVTRLSKTAKRWICACKRINYKDDEKCAFCGEPKPEKKKGEARYNVARGGNYNGRWYQSQLEIKYAQELDFRKKAGEVIDWKPQHRIEIKVNGVKICNYYIDFRVVLKDGSVQMVETKGPEQELWKLKWRLCMALKEEIEPGAEWLVVKK